jgi:hypothetical protein
MTVHCNVDGTVVWLLLYTHVDGTVVWLHLYTVMLMVQLYDCTL